MQQVDGSPSVVGLPPPAPHSQTWRLVDVVLIVISTVVILVLGLRGLALLKVDPLLVSLGATALEAVAIVGSVYFLGLRRRKLGWEAVGIRTPASKWVVAAIAAGCVCLVLTGLVSLLVEMALGQKLQNPQLPFLVPDSFTWAGAIGMFVLAGIVAPFAEELFFRGVLYTWLRDRWGVWVAVILSAALFGTAHGDVAIAVGVGVMGLIQAVLYERSRSLWTTFLVHAINNSVKVALLYLLLGLGVKLTGN